MFFLSIFTCTYIFIIYIFTCLIFRRLCTKERLEGEKSIFAWKMARTTCGFPLFFSPSLNVRVVFLVSSNERKENVITPKLFTKALHVSKAQPWGFYWPDFSDYGRIRKFWSMTPFPIVADRDFSGISIGIVGKVS